MINDVKTVYLEGNLTERKEIVVRECKRFYVRARVVCPRTCLTTTGHVDKVWGQPKEKSKVRRVVHRNN